MDEELIERFCKALDLSVSPDNALRKEAETFIIEAMDQPHFIVVMLQIASNVSYNEGRKIDITQAAAIQLKNITETHWRYENNDHAKELREDGIKVIVIPEEDK